MSSNNIIILRLENCSGRPQAFQIDGIARVIERLEVLNDRIHNLPDPYFGTFSLVEARAGSINFHFKLEIKRDPDSAESSSNNRRSKDLLTVAAEVATIIGFLLVLASPLPNQGGKEPIGAAEQPKAFSKAQRLTRNQRIKELIDELREAALSCEAERVELLFPDGNCVELQLIANGVPSVRIDPIADEIGEPFDEHSSLVKIDPTPLILIFQGRLYEGHYAQLLTSSGEPWVIAISSEEFSESDYAQASIRNFFIIPASATLAARPRSGIERPSRGVIFLFSSRGNLPGNLQSDRK